MRSYFKNTVSAVLPALAMLAAPTMATAADDEINAGKLAFNNACRTCHVLDEGDNRLGPNLHDIIGRKAGAAEGYAYSSALSGAGFAWTPERLDAFIANPDAVVPGHNMKPYSGLSDAAERERIIAYLQSQSTGGAPKASLRD